MCPKCGNVVPIWSLPDSPTDEGGAEYWCPVPTCLAHLYLHADWEGAGIYRNKVEILQ